MERQETLEVRRLTGEDFKQIVDIENASLNNPSMCMKSDLMDIDNSCFCGCSHAAFMDGRIVAYVLCYCNEYGVAFIDKCWVSPEFRGRGLQRSLVGDCIQIIMRRQLAKYIFTMCSPRNTISLFNFYKVGFKRSHSTMCYGHQRTVLRYEINN